jgi:hypothetical protein
MASVDWCIPSYVWTISCLPYMSVSSSAVSSCSSDVASQREKVGFSYSRMTFFILVITIRYILFFSASSKWAVLLV